MTARTETLKRLIRAPSVGLGKSAQPGEPWDLPSRPCLLPEVGGAVKSMGSIGQAPRHVGFFGQISRELSLVS